MKYRIWVFGIVFVYICSDFRSVYIKNFIILLLLGEGFYGKMKRDGGRYFEFCKLYYDLKKLIRFY